ncbi:nuclear pore complex protein NUP98A-like isoform X2 [Tripterygium wilfordii]|uniref:nuclear pore complex protein NUP98A-like isoform X2 n=1 Tax=Tripterygium wilfordii TaxID=458696 RepID=UPI0018F81184|nr:nuclear pore complex protein NUP98A-like isoform X2 [Tripterygium wilfordii]
MGVTGKAHGDTLAKQEEFSSGGFGSTAASPSLFAASSTSSINQSSIGLAATGPSAFPPPLFVVASSSNISNPANFGLAATGPSAFPPPLFGVASSSNISNPANFGLAVTGPSASPPPFFGVAASSNVSNLANFGFAASGPSAFLPPLFAAASSSNISNPANFGFAAGPSLSRPSLFAASCSGNSSTQALSWPAFLRPCTSSFNVSSSLFAAENPTATSMSPVFCSSSSNMTSLPKQSLFAPSSTYNTTTGSSPPVFGCGLIVNSSSGSSWVAPSSAPSYCFLNIPRSQTDSFPAPTAPSSSIFTTTATATVLPPNSSNKQEFSFGGFGSPASSSTFCASSSSISSTQAMSSGFFPFTNSVNAFSSSSSQINPPAVGFSSSKTKSSPTEVLFATTPSSTMASPHVSKFGFWPPINSSNAPPCFDFSCTPLHCFANIPSPSQKDSRSAQHFSSIFPTATTTAIFPARGEEVRKPASHLCLSCGQTLLSGNVYSPTLSFDQYRPWWLQSISAMTENQAKSHEELRWANHLLQGNAKDNVAPVAQSTILNQPQWTLPVMVLPVMPFPTWSTLPYTPASASTLPAFSANGAAFGYASSPSFSGTPMMPAVFNLSDMFRGV